MGLIQCKKCGRERDHASHGLCWTCYTSERLKTLPLDLCPVCGKMKPHYAKGMCSPCWQTNRLNSHPGIRHEYNQRSYKKDAESHRFATRRWSEANPDKVRGYAQLSGARRKARKRGLPATLTTDQWEAIKVAYRFRCAYCGKRPKVLSQDHVIPISKGGGTTADNIVPACKSCNSKKKDRPAPKATPKRLMF